MNIQIPRAGNPITADWARRVTQAVNGLHVTGGPGVRVTHSPNGVTVSLDAASAGSSGGGAEAGRDAYICEITGGSAKDGYTVRVMAEDGAWEDPPDDARLFFTEVAVGYDLPVGARIVAHAVRLAVNGGSDA